MKKRPRVFFYGSTVVLAGIEASLNLDPDCEIVGHTISFDPNELRALHPDVVIFELVGETPDFGMNLAQELPGLLLIGIDSETNRALLWSGWEARALTSRDLAEVIHLQEATTRTKTMEGCQYPVET
jgi:hypothetical protein